MSQNDSAPCGLSGCDKNVTNKSGGICCSRCQSWYHLGCAKVTTEEANFLSKMKRKFIFECSDCSSSSSEVADLRNEVRSSNNSIQNKLDALLSKVGNYDTQMKKLNDEINTCNSRIIEVDNTVSLKIKTLENKNEILQKRFNKLDIIINGLPREKLKVKETVFKIFKFLNINVADNEINTCCYINNRYSVLIKFNFLSKRDEVMQAYFKKRNLCEGDFLLNGSKKRIFLNDHLTEKGAKLCKLCRELRNDDIITKFRILNSDLPRVKIHFKDSSEKIFDFEECFAYFEKVERPRSKINKTSHNAIGPDLNSNNREIEGENTTTNLP